MNKPPALLLDENQALRVAELFAALGDPTRVKILSALLDGPMNVQSLAELTGISPSGVSHQMRGLRQTRLVTPHKEGRQVYYSLDDQHVADLFRRALDHVKHG